MQKWANASEKLSGLHAYNYKTDGDTEVHKFFQALSELIAAGEEGRMIGNEMILAIGERPEIAKQVLPHLKEDD